jgi:hypothetical protein
MRRFIIVFLLIGFSFLTACLPLVSIPAAETSLPSQTPPPTSTIVWFPPSATPTPIAIPTYTATPDMKPGIGSLIFMDDFTDATLWDTVDSPQAGATINNNHLTLAVEPGISIASLRRDPSLGDYYAEIKANVGLCRGEDTYGLLVRSTGNSFYRFALTCNGFVGVERIKDGVRLVILEPLPSGDVPLGPPGEVQIGIWALGNEMRLFLNGRYQFSITEKTFSSGALGVFVKSNSDTPLTITFSELSVYDVAYVAPTSTPIP